MRYPIYFEDFKQCIHCGSNSVVPVDIFGREQDVMIYPITHMICKECKTNYKIRWVKNKDDEMIPICCGESEPKELIDQIAAFAREQRRIIR